MTNIHLSVGFAVILFLCCYSFMHKKSFSLPDKSIYWLLGAGLVIRLIFAVTAEGFYGDIICFGQWAERIYTLGPANFYSPDVFTDYPPGFMYVLYIIGALRSLLNITPYSGAHLLLIKLPSIACDLACTYVVYREGKKRCNSTQGLVLAASYLFNPAIILNSSLWGQVDSVFTLAIILLCLYLVDGKMYSAYIVFGIGILLKPQTLVFTPVLLVAMLDYIFLKDFSYKKLFHHLVVGLSVILCMIIPCLPFGLKNVISQYMTTLGSYPYASVNAYNFWSLLGLNWSSQYGTFLSISYKNWGLLVILFIVLLTFIISLRNKNDRSKYPMLAAFIILTMFIFSVRMHERYMYPGLLLLLFAYLYKPVKANYLCYAGFSIMHLYNTAHVLFFYEPHNYNAKAPAILLTSAGMVFCIIYLYSNILRFYNGKNSTIAITMNTQSTNTANTSFFNIESWFGKKEPAPSTRQTVFTKLDLGLLIGIMVLYSTFALHDLGNRFAPVTTYDMLQGDSITLEFEENNLPTTMSYYIAPWHDRHFTLEGKNTIDSDWGSHGEVTLKNVFTWQEITLPNSQRYLRLTLSDYQASLLDITFTDVNGNVVTPLNASEYDALFDENSMRPEHSSYRDSMYFDEIYHGRTAYEFLNGLSTYENTHPPLGKVFISLGVAVFGMNPFGWRIAGTLFGIAMLPFLYLLGKRITHNTPAAALACFIFAFDFMHFTQTRLATIDVYITFFVILMYYFMYKYCSMSFYDTPLKNTLIPLGACGVCMGLGIASKWTGVYAGAGLAILFFGCLLRRYQEYRYAVSKPKGSTNGISHNYILKKFVPYTKKTIGFCMIFFVAVPVVIYILSYIPFVDSSHPGLLDKMLANQTSMFNYHNDLDATHPYSSSWYEWPTMVRPIWYYSNIVSDTVREGISAFGNPLVWWIGIPAFLFMIYLVWKKRDMTAAFLIVGYLAQYLPWFFVTRITFIYHYFPSVAFLVLMIIHSIMQLKKCVSKRIFLSCILVYGIAVFALFLLFYPVLSGQPVESSFVTTYLRWFDDWVLISA